jgi:hypothetical protein
VDDYQRVRLIAWWYSLLDGAPRVQLDCDVYTCSDIVMVFMFDGLLYHDSFLSKTVAAPKSISCSLRARSKLI